MKKLLKTLFLILGTVMISITLLIGNIHSSSTSYPNITTKFNVDKMSSYNEDNLFTSVTLKKFYVIGVTTDNVNQYRLVLTPKPNSNQYFYMTTSKHKKISVGQKITVKGQLNGRLTIPDDKYNRQLPSNVLNKNATMVLVKSYK